MNIPLRLGQYCVVLLVLCGTLAETTPPSTLRHVNLLYRHGDRSPVYIYPTDQHQLNAWPDGLGWLSNIGKLQHFKLGQYLRARYDGFINTTRYDHNEIKVEASAVQRCLMSAYSNLAGFFPPAGDQVWNPDLVWQPIPVTSVPEEDDNKLAIEASCPRYDQLYAEEFKSPKVLEYQAKNKEFLMYVANNTGLDHESLTNIWQVGDTLVCEKAHNMTWNNWAYKNGTFEKVTELVDFGWDLLYEKQEMAKLKGGPLLKEMIENMKVASKDSSSLPKIHMYSAHDSTVLAVTSAMTVSNHMQPPYRTLVMVELHNIKGEDVVKIFFRNDTTKDPYYLVPAGCEDPCKLSTFEKVLSSRIPVDWKAECEAVSSSPESLSLASIIAICIGCALLLVVIVGLVILVRRHHAAPYAKL